MQLDDVLGLSPQQGPMLLEGRFLTTATTVDDELQVRVPWLDGDRTGVPVVWAPYPGPSGPVLPTAGDPAWIAEATAADGDANAWVVVLWRPAS
jgi:hypothetical protein